MGNKVPTFSDQQLDDYQDCTFFTRKEILTYKELDPKNIPKMMAGDEAQTITIPMEKMIKMQELKENPFKERICKVFSHDGSGNLTFDDFLDMLSVMSESATREIKVFYAFKIYDFDEDHFISRYDIEQATIALTKGGLEQDEMDVVCDKVLDEADIDDDGSISFTEFQHVISRAPDFLSVKNWAFKFGKEIHIGSTQATCFEVVENNYLEMGAKPIKRDASKIMEEMITDIENMFQWKMEHVRRIAERAEELAANHTFDSHLPFEYYNAKKLFDEDEGPPALVAELPDKERRQYKGLTLQQNPLFHNIAVSYEESAVHVPVNVYEENPALKKQIKWSISLKDVFRNNRVIDPDIYWQYFCSSHGFMRLYPAAKWRIPDFLKLPDSERKPLDLYDCRMRDWFIKAAASPKDIIILLDGSGSMSGQRKEIARNVVINILETLTDDDYVTVLRFSDIIEPVVPCFGERLVEANSQNVLQFKQQLTLLNTTDIANFSMALRTAFQILKQAGREKSASNCNQAIMLITDGAPGNDRLDHKSIFEEFNYPRIDIRMFSYLVGKEVTDTKEVNWMACANKGYYTHVANLAEIREQVQLYLPVMSRPLVLARDRIYAFTPVYADVVDIPLNNWVWEAREREKIRQSIRRRIRDTSINPDEVNFEDYENGQDKNELSQEKNELSQEKNDINLDKNENVPGKNEKNIESTNKIISKKISDSEIDKINEENLEDDKEYDYDYEKQNKTKSSSKLMQMISMFSNLKNSPLTAQFFRAVQAPLTQNWVQNSESGYSFEKMNLDNENNMEIVENVEEKPIKKKRGVNELMMTIAAPVFDTKNTTNTTEKYLEKNVWKQRIKEVRSANLLGVAGVDVPIKEIVRLTPAYRLGVNGYSFAINNNGHILYHPDLRPLFQDLLKPFYSSIDFSEVELQDNDANPRTKNQFEQFRSNMINRLIAWDKINVKIHLDQMKRVLTRNQTYYTQPIKNTPFSLGIVLPENYGRFYISGQIEFKRRDENYTKYFKGSKWRVHPEWVYCDDDPSNKIKGVTFKTPEDGVLLFLERAAQSEKNIRWKSPSLSPQVYEELTCNKDLVQSLIFDAKATDIDGTKCGTPKDLTKYEQDIANKFGVTLTFIATRSGLSRFEEHWEKSARQNQAQDLNNYENEEENLLVEDSETDKESEFFEEDEDELPFKEVHNKAIDEVFYKRAVDFHIIDPQAFVFSVPFSANLRPESKVKVTASRAIFIGSGIEQAPAAVVGLQIQLNQFADRFFNTTKQCVGLECENVCSRNNNSQFPITCLIVDNNGYIVVSSVSHAHTGKFFGEIDYNLFTTLLDLNIYRAIRMYDYQAICIELLEKVMAGGAASLQNIFTLIFYLQKVFFIFLLEFFVLLSDVLTKGTTAFLQEMENEEVNYNPTMFKGMVKDIKGKLLPPNRTRPYSCDKEFYLYEIKKDTRKELLDQPIRKEYLKCDECQQEFIVSAIKNTNLLLVVYKDICPCEPLKVKITPKTIVYEQECTAEMHHVGRPRKRPTKCNNYNPQEAEIKQCGGANSILPSISIIVLLSLSWLYSQSYLSQTKIT